MTILDRIPPAKHALQHMSSIVWLLIETCQETMDYVLAGRPPFRLSIFFQETDRSGVGSIPLVRDVQAASPVVQVQSAVVEEWKSSTATPL